MPTSSRRTNREDHLCVVEGCSNPRRFPRVQGGPDEVCHGHATLPYPDGPWTKEQEDKILAMEDDGFLNQAESLPLFLGVQGHYSVTSAFLDRLIKMADARPVLREIEWKGEHRTCPWCGGFKPGEPKPSDKYVTGHDVDCQLEHVLKA